MEASKTISRKDLKTAWVAGLFDGEGSVGLYAFTRADGKNPSIIKRLTIENTNFELVDSFIEFLKEHKIKYYYWKPNLRRGRTNSPICAATVCSYRGCKKLLELLLPYLVGKKKQAQTLLDYFEYRDTIGWTNFPERVYEFADKIKQLKKSSETIRSTSDSDEDIVHSS